MLSKMLDIVVTVLRGAWRPLYRLDPRRRWWHYVDYWAFRSQEILTTICVVLFPFGLGFVVYDRYASNPTGTVAFSALIAIIWLCVVALSYSRGRALSVRDTATQNEKKGTME